MQKYIIFGKYKQVTITNSLPKDIKTRESVVIECGKEWQNSLDFPSLLEQKAGADNIFLLSKDKKTEKVFEQFTRQFFFVKAAGGIVRNEDGQTLFIYRNGVWDLPKGHVENGETDEQAAIREVEEETGLKPLSIRVFAGFTYHTYYMNRRWELKQTAWYFMQSSKQNAITPQREEGIEKAVWIKQSEIADILRHSYPSIQELFKRF